MWVESTFGVHVDDSEVLPENFDSDPCSYQLRRAQDAGNNGRCFVDAGVRDFRFRPKALIPGPRPLTPC